MRSRSFAALALGMLLAASVPAAAFAGEIPGRPGQYELEKLEVSTEPHDYCYAIYKEEPPGGDVNVGTDWDGYATVRIVENKNWIKVVCKAIDISGASWESNAEVGYIENQCILVTDAGVLDDGDGKMVVAANTPSCPGGEEPCSNITMTCKFKK